MKRVLLLVAVAALVTGCGSSGRCLQGTELVLRVTSQREKPLTAAGLELARQIIESRVQTIGVSSPSVTTRGSDEIVLGLGGAGAIHHPAFHFATVGQLQIFDFEHDLAPPTVTNGNPTPYASLYNLLSAVKSEAPTGPTSTPQAYYLFDAKRRIIGGPDPTETSLLSLYRGKKPAGSTILAAPAGREAVAGPSETAATRPVGRSPDSQYWYLFKLPPEISNADLNPSAISSGPSMDNGQPEVNLGFTSHGAAQFQKITQAEYQRGQLVSSTSGGNCGQGNQLCVQHNAIVLDGKLIATPFIDYTDSVLSLGIVGGEAVLNNMGSIQEAKDVALILREGPLSFKRVSLKLVCVG